MKKFLLNLLFLAVVTPLAAQTLILPGDYADPIILKDGDLGRGLIVASVHGNGNPCTDAVVFAVAGPVLGSVGQRNGDSVYRRSGPRAKVFGFLFACGRKCAEVFINTIRNSMKTRYLACRNVGRKYVKNFQYSIVISEKITTFASQ